MPHDSEALPEPAGDRWEALEALLAAGALLTERALRRLWPAAVVAGSYASPRPWPCFRVELELDERLMRDDLVRLETAIASFVGADSSRGDSPAAGGGASRAAVERAGGLLHLALLEVSPLEPLHDDGMRGGRQTVLGVVRPDQRALRRAVALHERAQDLDHVRLGESLGLFRRVPRQPGRFVWLPAGMLVQRLISELLRSRLQSRGFLEVHSPIPLSSHHALVFAAQPRSEASLPLRLFEEAVLPRFQSPRSRPDLRNSPERRADFLSVFTTAAQVDAEIAALAGEARALYQALGLPFRSVEPASFFLRDLYGAYSLPAASIAADSAPSGPRSLTYRDAASRPQTPCHVWGTLLGSYEDIIAAVLESSAGSLPLWLSPAQVRVIPIAEAFLPAAERIRDALASAGLRSEIDRRTETLAFKLRAAWIDRVPYFVEVGPREAAGGELRVHSRDRAVEPADEALGSFAERIRIEAAASP
jgi:threonyl-tRNA synthetase